MPELIQTCNHAFSFSNACSMMCKLQPVPYMIGRRYTTSSTLHELLCGMVFSSTTQCDHSHLCHNPIISNALGKPVSHEHHCIWYMLNIGPAETPSAQATKDGFKQATF